MDVGEVMDEVQEMMDKLEACGKLHRDDAEVQALVSDGAFAGARAMKTLALMLLYKESSESEATNGNGNSVAP